MGTGQRGEVVQLLLQDGQVVGSDIIGILLVCLLGESPALLFASKSKEILGELDAGCGETRVQLEGATLGGGALGEAVFLGELSADQVIDLRVGFPRRERLLSQAIGGGLVVFEVGQDGEQGEGRRMARVESADRLQFDLCGVVVLRVDAVLGQEQAGGNVVGISDQGLRGVFHQLGAVTVLEGRSQAPPQVGIVDERFQPFLEGARGDGVIVLLQPQFPGRDEGVAGGRVWVRLGGLEEVFEHQPRLDSEEQGGFAGAGEEVGADAIARGVVGEKAEFLKVLRGLFGAAGVEGGFAGEETQSNRGGDTRLRFLEHTVRLLVPAVRQQNLGFQTPGAGLVGVEVAGSPRQGERLLVIAGAERGPAVLQFVRVGGRSTETDQEREEERPPGTTCGGRGMRAKRERRKQHPARSPRCVF